jgi:acyl dehydratase
MLGMITFDDLHIGQRFQFTPRQVSERDIISFAREFDPQSFHVDPVMAKDSPFGGLIASGWHTCSMMMRMLADAWILNSSCAGSPGIDALKWAHPVRPNDTLQGYAEVMELKPSKSKPDRGITKVFLVLKNQHEQTVLEMQAHIIFLRRS